MKRIVHLLALGKPAPSRARKGVLPDSGSTVPGPGEFRCRSGGVLSPVREMGRDRGRESGLESVWRRRSQGKVRTWDGSAADRGRNGRGPGTEMWYWWPVVLQVLGKVRTGDGTAADRRRKSGTGGLWCCRSGGVLSPVREMGRDRGRKCRASPRRGGRRGRRP